MSLGWERCDWCFLRLCENVGYRWGLNSCGGLCAKYRWWGLWGLWRICEYWWFRCLIGCLSSEYVIAVTTSKYRTFLLLIWLWWFFSLTFTLIFYSVSIIAKQWELLWSWLATRLDLHLLRLLNFLLPGIVLKRLPSSKNIDCGFDILNDASIVVEQNLDLTWLWFRWGGLGDQKCGSWGLRGKVVVENEGRFWFVGRGGFEQAFSEKLNWGFTGRLLSLLLRNIRPCSKRENTRSLRLCLCSFLGCHHRSILARLLWLKKCGTRLSLIWWLKSKNVVGCWFSRNWLLSLIFNTLQDFLVRLACVFDPFTHIRVL